MLCEAGWVVEFDPITYLPEIQPSWKEGGRGDNKRPRGYWEKLRNSRVQIHPPKEILEGIAKIQRKRKTISAADKTVNVESKSVSRKRNRSKSLLSGEQIKAGREQKGWSQQELGEKLGKTKMWVSLIERDKRSIKLKDAKQLQAILELN